MKDYQIIDALPQTPMVSVAVLAYNHEEYIAQAIEGILMQKTSYSFKITIAEDCSTDFTRQILLKYQEKYPEKIKLLLQNKNVGAQQNNIDILSNLDGKYIATCEGDDYWTDPLKLQKQVDFLKENKDYVLSFTNRNILRNDILEISKPLHNQFKFNKSEIPAIHVPTLTAVFKNVIEDIPAKMRGKIIDASLFLFLSQYGSFHYLNEKTAVYRVHDGGAWSGSTELINYTRSVDARLAAWKHFPAIDRLAVARSLVNWIKLKKIEERSQKMHWSALQSIFQEFYFTSYIRFNKLLSKNDSL